MVEFNTFYVEEPDLYFSNKSKFKDAKGGLYLYGPYGKFETEEFPLSLNAGIIGSSKSMGRTTSFFKRIEKRVMAESKGGVHFPGLGLEKRLNLEVKFEESLKELITNKEIEECEKKEDRADRARFVLDIIDSRLASLKREPLPDLVFIPIPGKIINLCKTPGQVGDKITIAHRRFSDKLTKDQIKGDYDFHDIIKVLGMKHEIPTQVILPHSLSLKRNPYVQYLAQRAWNITVASYYKAKGIPWKLAELDQDTCYAGISFYRELDEKGSPSMRASIAQLFLATGESIVLRGNPFEWPRRSKYPKLTEDQSIELVDLIIDKYVNIHRDQPRRLVIHKTSMFNEEEIDGFLRAYDVVDSVDLLSMRSSPFDWYRDGRYAIPRRTIIKPHDKIYYIFTLGYIPQLRTFPKPGIPIPIEVKPANLDSSQEKMCKEILSLTKLNWNNADFCDQMPITITAAEKVGNILSEGKIKEIDDIKSEYRYYI